MNKKERLVAAIKNGTVIDHIPAEKTYQVATILGLRNLTTPVTIGYNYPSKKIGSKGIIKVSDKFFTDEEIAMCLSGLYQEERIKDSNPSFYDSGRWMVVPFPVFEDSVASVSSASYIHYFLVNADRSASERRAGWLLASFLTEHADEYLDEVGLLVPLKSLMEGERVSAKPYGDIFLSELKRSHPIYSGEYASEIQLLIGEAVESVMLQGIDPEKAVASLRASVSYLFSR